MEFKYAENTKYLILALVGMVMAFIGYLTYVINPLELIVNSMLTLTPGSFLFNLWVEPPLEIFAKMYVFNVTNAEEFLAGKEKLRVEEVGPYTYQEVLKNTEGVINENGTLTYKPVRTYIFRPEHSVGDPEIDTVITPNIPLLGVGSFLSSYNSFVNYGYNIMTLQTKQFISLSVNDYLWGYKDELVTLASTFVPSWIDFTTFGILDRILALDGANTVTLHLKEVQNKSDNPIMPYSISKFNGSPGLKQWNYEDVEINETSDANNECNTIEGSYDGGLFPRNFQENRTISLYRRAFCRPVKLRYENTSTNQDGFKVYNYRVDPNFLASGDVNPDNKCYCKNGECLPNGFSSLAPCYYGIPIIISQPHLYNADESVKKQIDGFYPNKEKHDTIVQINPEFGVPLSANLRIQINLKVVENRIVSKLRPFNKLILPLCWIELEVKDIPSHLKFLFHLVIYTLPIMQDVLMWILGILGISLVGVSALIVFYFPPEKRLEDPYGHRIGYSPILVLPLSSRLKPDVRIS